LKHLVVSSSVTVLTALQTLDVSKLGIVFVVDELRVVLGVVTDGDLRHVLARGVTLNSPVSEIMNRDFVHGRSTMSAAELKAKLPGRTRIMPVLDDDRRLFDYASDAWPA